jgi:hypothetical protein
MGHPKFIIILLILHIFYPLPIRSRIVHLYWIGQEPVSRPMAHENRFSIPNFGLAIEAASVNFADTSNGKQETFFLKQNIPFIQSGCGCGEFDQRECDKSADRNGHEQCGDNCVNRVNPDGGLEGSQLNSQAVGCPVT